MGTGSIETLQAQHNDLYFFIFIEMFSGKYGRGRYEHTYRYNTTIYISSHLYLKSHVRILSYSGVPAVSIPALIYCIFPQAATFIGEGHVREDVEIAAQQFFYLCGDSQGLWICCRPCT
jgi:hypothetical protein